MRDSIDDLEMDLGRLPEIRNTDTPTPSAAQQIRKALRGKHVCPFCGTQRETDVGACMHCSLEDTPTTRSATRGKLGPWYVLQSRNPSAPGMNFATLMVLVQKGKVTARSVLRGPTTGQFWRHAAKVKGVSREFSLCWNCGGDIAKNARACPGCKRLQEPPLNPDMLLENGEFSSEELAEAMWADQTGESSQMPSPPVPRAAPSPVDRLVARGGVRRELTPHPYEAPGTLPRQQQRGMMNDADVEELPHTRMEMDVFQRPRPGARQKRGVMGKIFKALFVAVLLAALGLGAMCTFDEGFRQHVISVARRTYDTAKSWISGSEPAAKPLPAPAADFTGDSDRGVIENKKLPTETGGIGQTTQVTIGGRDIATPAERQMTSSALTTTPAIPAADQARSQIWKLWNEGKTAEGNRDFAGALKAWEAIKNLPVDESELPVNLSAKIGEMKTRLK